MTLNEAIANCAIVLATFETAGFATEATTGFHHPLLLPLDKSSITLADKVLSV
jgi:hypothetical protein